MDLSSIGLLEAEINDLRALARHREWNTVLKLVDEVAKFYAKEVMDTKKDINETNVSRGRHQGCLQVYRWLRSLYDETHGDTKR